MDDVMDDIKEHIMNYVRYTGYPKLLPRTTLMPGIKKIIYNYPATIVLWSDGTKTVVKCTSMDIFDPQTGLAYAIAKKFFSSRSQLKKAVENATYTERMASTTNTEPWWKFFI